MFGRPRINLGIRTGRSSVVRSMRKPVRIQAREARRDDAYGDNWERLKRQCKTRDNWTCRDCGWRATSPWMRWKLDAHHIIPKSKGGPNSLSNLKTVCKERCHDKYHPHMQRRKRG